MDRHDESVKTRLRCRLIGHRERYELAETHGAVRKLRAVCTRDGCEYAELFNDPYDIRKTPWDKSTEGTNADD